MLKLKFFFLLAIVAVNAQSISEIYKKGILEAEKVITIGGENDESASWSELSMLGLLKEKIYALERRNQKFYSISKDGKILKTFGKIGRGPGELNGINNFGVGNSMIYTYDAGNRRFSAFDENGKCVLMESSTSLIWSQGRNENSGFVFQESSMNDNIDENKILLFSYDEKFTNPKLILSKTLESEESRKPKQLQNGVGVTRKQPFMPNFFWAVLPNKNVAACHSSENIVDIVSPEGKKVANFELKMRKERVTYKDQDAYFEQFENETDRYGRKRTKENIEQLKKTAEFPSHKPYFSSLKIDSEGNILFKTYKKDDEYFIWEVRSPNGDFIGNVKIKPELLNNSAIFDKNYIWQIEDENGFSIITKNKIK